jgi:hypothetical protein
MVRAQRCRPLGPDLHLGHDGAVGKLADKVGDKAGDKQSRCKAKDGIKSGLIGPERLVEGGHQLAQWQQQPLDCQQSLTK